MHGRNRLIELVTATDRDCVIADAIAKKRRICGGHRASATRMVNSVGEMIAAFEAAPTSELDVK